MVETIKEKVYFYDTNAVLELQNKIFDQHFYISSVTLEELEKIKTSSKHDETVKYKARKILHLLDEYTDKYDVVMYQNVIGDIINEKLIEITPDSKIVACCSFIQNLIPCDQQLVFCTNDIACKMIANKIFGLHVESICVDDDHYTGYKEISMSEDEMAYFYEHINENIYNLLTGEYLLLSNSNGEIVDKLKWDGEAYQNIKFPNIKSAYFGTIKPYNGDIYQQLALNSFNTNQITMIKGAAGTGKSYLALGYLMWLLEKRKIDKIIMFANPTPTANSAKIGFLPGSQLEKLTDSSVGNMLGSKLGDKFMIEQLVAQNKLSILPMCDIRGYDTTGMNAGIYITEAQNLDISLMKLALQRIGDDSICIIDGDCEAQVDLNQYAGSNNGMKRMSKVFRGQDFYGEVTLQNIYRSKISRIADEM